MTSLRRTLAVCGPTASGKSDLSIHLAQNLGGEIVNVDSVQVFRELDIGSAKLKEADRCGIPHHVLDIFAPNEAANVASFRQQALHSIDDIISRDRLPILVGGSGLYLTALLHGLAEVPPTPADVREAVASLSLTEQYAELQRVDPASATRLNPNDSQRISRAVEICRITGRPASDILAEHTFTSVDVVSLVLVICKPRNELYDRIDRRASEMIKAGLVAEAARIRDRYGQVSALSTLGYKQACDYLDGNMPEEAIAREIALHTRRFAKRQMTYWRNEPMKRGWVVRPTEQEPAQFVSGFEEFPVRAQKHMKGFRAFSWNREELVERVRARLRVALDTDPLSHTEVWFVTEKEQLPV
ncbi:MAG: tRNA (adenosine(37)-N6)-dimethylallyltransferase MiaA [Pseudomonadota bacterium]